MYTVLTHNGYTYEYWTNNANKIMFLMFELWHTIIPVLHEQTVLLLMLAAEHCAWSTYNWGEAEVSPTHSAIKFSIWNGGTFDTSTQCYTS